MRKFACIIAASALGILTACSTQAGSAAQPSAETASVHPESGLRVIPLQISASGKVTSFRVELAETPAQQEQGLMFRRAMGANEGMLFPSQFPQVRSFWMKNTVIPLDLIFVGTDHKIINIAANAVPYSLDSIESVGPAIAVLELNGGRAAELGVGPGATVTW